MPMRIVWPALAGAAHSHTLTLNTMMPRRWRYTLSSCLFVLFPYRGEQNLCQSPPCGLPIYLYLELTDLLLPQDALAPAQNPGHFCCLAHIISPFITKMSSQRLLC